MDMSGAFQPIFQAPSARPSGFYIHRELLGERLQTMTFKKEKRKEGRKRKK